MVWVPARETDGRALTLEPGELAAGYLLVSCKGEAAPWYGVIEQFGLATRAELESQLGDDSAVLPAGIGDWFAFQLREAIPVGRVDLVKLLDQAKGRSPLWSVRWSSMFSAGEDTVS